MMIRPLRRAFSTGLCGAILLAGSLFGSLSTPSVAHAADFGYTTAFGSLQNAVANKQVATKVTMPEDGIVIDITAYVGGISANKEIRYAIYADAGGEPGALVVESTIGLTTNTMAWRTINIPPTTLAAGDYWLALAMNHVNQQYAYNAGGGQTRENGTDAVSDGYSTNWGAPTASNTRQVSIYATYAPVNPATYYVRKTGSDASSGTSPATAWQTIGKAASTMVVGDTVYVGAGTYAEKVLPADRGTAGSPIQYLADSSGAQTGDAGDVTIQAPVSDFAIEVSGQHHVHFVGFIVRGDGAASAAVLFTASQGGRMQNCDVYNGAGAGGIDVSAGDLTLDGCTVRNNTGSGIRQQSDSSVTLLDCTIKNNTGLGIEVSGSNLQFDMRRTMVSGNGSYGVFLDGVTATLFNCLIVANGDDAVRLGQSAPLAPTVDVWHCTIANNTGDGFEQNRGTLTITNCIVANNGKQGLNRDLGTMTHTYNLVYGHSTNFAGTSQSTGEIVSDPTFIGYGDYHLFGGSPAFNAATDASGTLTDDLEGNTRPVGGGWDMGCYEVDPPIYLDLVDGYASNSPVAWWRLNEDAGAAIAVDAMGSNNGLYSGGAQSGATGAPIGGVNGAAQLDGSNDYISTGTMDVSGQEITILGWFKADSFAAGEAKLVSKSSGTDDDSHYWSLGVNNSGSGVRLQFRIKTEGTTDSLLASSGNLAAGAWVFAAAAYDGANIFIYKDGVRVGQSAKSGAIDTDAATQVWLGGNPSGSTDQPLGGLMDEVAIFNTALSSVEIAAIYAGSLRGRGNGKVVIPTLWGVDRDDADLFAIGDYQNPAAGTTTFGPLKWDDAGTLTDLNGLLRAIAVDASARMFLVADGTLGAVTGPVLLRMNLEDATASGDNVVTVIGQLGTGSGIAGLSVDPISDDLYAIRSDGRLYIVDKTDGSVSADLGQVAGQGESITTAEDLTFDAMGNLYVIDNGDDEIYRVDKTTAEILEVYADGNSGIGTMQGLAWDHLNHRILVTDTGNDDLHYSPLSGYGVAPTSSLSAQALTDVEAISFVPTEGVAGGSPGVRVLRWIEIK